MAGRLVLGTRAVPYNFASPAEVSFAGFEKLRRPLQLTVGAAGSNALLSRALVLTKAECSRLAGVTLNKKGFLEGLGTIDPPLTGKEAEEGELLLIANAVELLCLFLGEAMTLRLLQDEWPDASFSEESSEKGRNA